MRYIKGNACFVYYLNEVLYTGCNLLFFVVFFAKEIKYFNTCN